MIFFLVTTFARFALFSRIEEHQKNNSNNQNKFEESSKIGSFQFVEKKKIEIHIEWKITCACCGVFNCGCCYSDFIAFRTNRLTRVITRNKIN